MLGSKRKASVFTYSFQHIYFVCVCVDVCPGRRIKWLTLSGVFYYSKFRKSFAENLQVDLGSHSHKEIWPLSLEVWDPNHVRALIHIITSSKNKENKNNEHHVNDPEGAWVRLCTVVETNDSSDWISTLKPDWTFRNSVRCRFTCSMSHMEVRTHFPNKRAKYAQACHRTEERKKP